MKFYENRNNNKKSDFFKLKTKDKKVIFRKSITNEFRRFDVGEVVGIKSTYRDEEYIIESFKYIKNGRLIYILKNEWETKYEARGNEVYLRPLTRRVLFEKYRSILKFNQSYIYSASTMIQYFIS